MYITRNIAVGYHTLTLAGLIIYTFLRARKVLSM